MGILKNWTSALSGQANDWSDPSFPWSSGTCIPFTWLLVGRCTFLPFDFRVGQVICLGQWEVCGWIVSLGLKYTCELGLAILCSYFRHGKDTTQGNALPVKMRDVGELKTQPTGWEHMFRKEGRIEEKNRRYSGLLLLSFLLFYFRSASKNHWPLHQLPIYPYPQYWLEEVN